MGNFTNTVLPNIQQYSVSQMLPSWLENTQSGITTQGAITPIKVDMPNSIPQLLSTKDLNSSLIKPINDKKGIFSDKMQNGLPFAGQLLSSIYDTIPTADNTINSNDELSSNIRGNVNKQLLSGAAGPWGMLAGAINMGIDKTGGFTDASKGLGKATDTLNTIASIALPGAGWFTKKTIDYKVSDTLKESGAAYSGTLDYNSTAAQNSGAKLLFGRNKANQKLSNASLYDTKVQNIMQENEVAQSGANNPYIGIRNAYNMQGSWQNNIHFGRKGLKVSPLQVREITQKVLTDKRNKKSDNSYSTFEEYYSKLPEAKRDTINYNLRRAFELAPKKELDDFLLNPDAHLKTIYFNSDGIGEFLKSKNHPTLWMELEYYNNGNDVITKKQDGKEYHFKVPANQEEWKDFKNRYDLDTTGTFYKYIPKKFKEGGKVNVIPDGALHARKHNIDIEGITKKGIPVVTEDSNGEVEQQAEIEKEEIIFRLEITKKLEELQKKYYSEDSTQKEKDELALEAGKLLVHEILYNTTDNVNLIEKTV